jgi:hypothetical protein
MGSYVVQLVPESHWLIADRMDSDCLRMITTLIRLAYVVRHGFETPSWACSGGQGYVGCERRVNCNANASCTHQRERPNSRATGPYGIRVRASARRTVGRMKSREEQLSWAKQRARICVDAGHFSDAVAGLRSDLDANPLTKGLMSSDQARRGYKAASDAALGRGSQALTEWIEGFR